MADEDWSSRAGRHNAQPAKKAVPVRRMIGTIAAGLEPRNDGDASHPVKSTAVSSGGRRD